MKFFLCILGMVMIIEGLPYFASPEKMKQWIMTLIEMDDNSLRWIGFWMMLAGLLLIYVGRS